MSYLHSTIGSRPSLMCDFVNNPVNSGQGIFVFAEYKCVFRWVEEVWSKWNPPLPRSNCLTTSSLFTLPERLQREQKSIELELCRESQKLLSKQYINRFYSDRRKKREKVFSELCLKVIRSWSHARKELQSMKGGGWNHSAVCHIYF